MNLEEMIEALTEYYEKAGYEDYYDAVLKDKSEDEIRELYENIIEEEELDDLSQEDEEYEKYDKMEDEIQSPLED